MYILRKVLVYFLILRATYFILQTADARAKKSNVKVKEKVCLFQYFRYEYNPVYFSKYVYEIKSENTSLNYDYTLKKDIDDDFWIEVNIRSFNRKTSSWSKMFAFDVNLCGALSPVWTRKFNIISVWIINLMKFGNITQTCPIRAGNYTYLNFKPEKISLAPFNGIYRVDSLLYRSLENKSRDNVLKFSLACDIRMK